MGHLLKLYPVVCKFVARLSLDLEGRRPCKFGNLTGFG